MARSAYGRVKPRATKKKRAGAKKSPPEKKRKAKKPVAQRLTRKRVAKRRSKTSTERKVGAKRPKLSKKTVNARSRKRSSSAVRKASKKTASAKPRAKTKATPKAKAKPRAKKAAASPKRRAAAPRRKKPVAKVKSRLQKLLTPAQKGARTKARRKAEREALAKQLAKLNKDRAKLRNKGTKAKRSLRQKLNARLKDIAKRRTDRTLVIEKLPRHTPRAKKKSREELFEHFRARFHELHEIARKKRQLPVVDYRERHIESEKNTGEIRIIRIEREVTEGSVEQIMYKVRKAAQGMSGFYPIWLGVLVFTGMGERLIGYGNRVLDAQDPDAAQFQTQGIESTGILPTVEGMLMGIEDLLTEYADEEYTVVFCEHIKVMNFSRMHSK